MKNYVSHQTSPEVSSKASVLTACASVVIAVFLYTIRRIDQLLNPQLWAEDGLIFLQDQISLGLDAILKPYAGYLHLLPRLIAMVTDHVVTIDYVPTVYMLGALLTATLASFFVALSRVPWPAGPLFTLAAMMVPHGGEIFLNITNTQWIIAPTLMIIAIQDEPQKWCASALDLLIIGIVGLTGPFIIFALPFIISRLVWHSRSRYNIALAVTATTVASTQAMFIFNTSELGGEHNLNLEMYISAFDHFWFGLVLGFITQAPSALRYFMELLTLAMGIILIFLLPTRSRIIAEILIVVAIMIFAVSATKLGTFASIIQPLSLGQRYFYIPYVLIMWVFVLGMLQIPKPANSIAAILILIIVASAARAFQAPPLPDMEWHKHMNNVGAEPVQVPINPSGWIITVHR